MESDQYRRLAAAAIVALAAFGFGLVAEAVSLPPLLTAILGYGLAIPVIRAYDRNFPEEQ